MTPSPRQKRRSVVRQLLVPVTLLLVLALLPSALTGQGGGESQSLPTIEEKTEGMTRIDGFFPLYYEAEFDRLWMEVSRFDTEVLHMGGLAAGLGSNDVGLDRGSSSGSRIVFFERHGRKVMMIQPNLRFRAESDNPAEERAVRDAFARSVLFAFDVAAESDGRVLVDLTDFVLSDQTRIASRLAGYQFNRDRSSIYLPLTQGFPENTEIEAELTFVQGGATSGAGGGRGGRSFFEGVSSVAASGAAASLRVHQSFVKLPDEPMEGRAFDPRQAAGAATWQDYTVPLGEPMTTQVIRRHRLEKVDPNAAVSDPVEPIVYYLDAGVPEPMRSALLEGARWWNDAYEAIGYRNAFRVEILPEGASSLDVRYNVINWVHRSTRGWSSGGSVTDPRSGEILKGTVTLGSLRVRQDYMLAEGLLSPYAEGTETPPELEEWALARLRQLSAHEVGHTLGFGHNYYDSEEGRISVMDYPHPLVTLNPDGSLDYSEVYDVGIAEWDSVSVAYAYQDFRDGVNEEEELQRILDDAWERDLIYLSGQDTGLHPKVDVWSNGTDAAEELERMMAVRSAAMTRFGERAIKLGRPMAEIEKVLVPLYLHHRYQIDAAGSMLGGVDYIYSLRGDGRTPFNHLSGPDQRRALGSLLGVLEPSELALPQRILDQIPPRPSGFRAGREFFPRWTGGMFDVITPGVVLADHTLSNIFENSKAARMVQQSAVDPSIPGLGEVIDEVFGSVFGASVANPYEAEISRAVEWLAVTRVMGLAGSAPMPQVRAIALKKLEDQREALVGMMASADDSETAHLSL
ncbi:MAG: zinc-dependent metalloprotease, partial [Gemmatimonadetes bacterium]|nr:zinc-dependent metalloprotease [Gemmatimonadota bacterium]